ncbi:S1 family peptidase [Streptomyces sp. 12297]|uniref:S1 family peptidase n=1 Tax=Streptomyces sp. NBC_00239 TaxID=2903640 RepID=UPI002E2B783D|nr:S1 family peptidase [Streptomyces sp. NBC_00239]
MAAATATTAVVLGVPTQTASAAEEVPVNAASPFAFEDGAYPNRDGILSATGADLIAGDGGIEFTSCDGPYQIMVWARNLKTNDSTICFKADNTGYLAVNIPRAYRIETFDRDVRAAISINSTTQTVDVPEDTVKAIGEGTATDPKQAVLLEMRITGSSGPRMAGQPINDADLKFNAKLEIGEGKRSCSGALVDPYWVITAKSCFADDPAQSNTVAAGVPKDKTKVSVGKAWMMSGTGFTSDATELVPHPDRDLVMVRLANPATGIAPVDVSSAAPTTGEELDVVGYGRTRTGWGPVGRHGAAFSVGTTAATGFDLAAKTPADATVCRGDAGASTLRTVNGKRALVGLVSRAWQGGCLGTSASELRTGAYSTRVDDQRDWVQRVRALSPGWRTQALIQSGSSLYQGIRLADGSWTGFNDVQVAGQAGTIGAIRSSAVVGMNGDSHVLAVTNAGGLFHTIRKQDGTWAGFGDVFGAANALGNLTSVTASNIGYDLHVVAVADGKAFHTIRTATHWTPFKDITSGKVANVTAAATAVVRGELQVTTVSGGKAYHTIRQGNGNWLAWGDVAGAAGPTGPITSISTVGSGDDTHVVVATDNGTRQYHAVRNFNGIWTRMTELKGILGTVTAKSVATANVEGEVVVAVTTADGKLLHTVRHADGTWATTGNVTLQGLPAAPGALAITGTWNG